MNTPKKENKTIGIIGGMGPLATVDLFGKIVNLCDCKTDLEHPRVLIDSNTNGPDRSPAILRGGPSPLSDMVRSALTLERGGADVLADAVRKSFRETLERYAERLSNTAKLREHFSAK